MSAIEASSGTYRSRVDGTIVLSVEIEPRHAAAALALFGMPGTPIALAALQAGYGSVGQQKTGGAFTGHVPVSIDDAATKTIAEKPKGGALAQLAGRWCNDPEFYLWVRPVYDVLMGGNGKGHGDVHPDEFQTGAAGYCRHCVLFMCEIDSRAELDNDPVAAEKFHRLVRGPYSRYLISRGIVS